MYLSACCPDLSRVTICLDRSKKHKNRYMTSSLVHLSPNHCISLLITIMVYLPPPKSFLTFLMAASSQKPMFAWTDQLVNQSINRQLARWSASQLLTKGATDWQERQTDRPTGHLFTVPPNRWLTDRPTDRSTLIGCQMANWPQSNDLGGDSDNNKKSKI